MVDPVETQQSTDQSPEPVETSSDQELLDAARDPDAVSSALAHEREKSRQMKRERDALMAKVSEFEDRDKTEQQKLAERAQSAEQRFQEAELRALRFEVAVEKGLVGERAALAARLSGNTKEELAADADQLLALFPAEPPTTSFDGGARGAPANSGTMDDFVRRASGRH